MIVAKPIHAFAVGAKHVLSCLIPQSNPHRLIEKSVVFRSSSVRQKSLRIVGISTAQADLTGVYDLLYTGETIFQKDIAPDATLETLDDIV